MRIILLFFCLTMGINACQQAPKEELRRDKKPAAVEIGDYPERGQGLQKDSIKQMVESIADSVSPETTKNTVAKEDLPEQKSKTDSPQTAAKKSQEVKKKFPKIFFEEPVYHFDTITEGDVIDHVFRFKNIGDRELNLLKVVPGCGCTLPTYPFIGIAPGEQNQIKVRYNSVSKYGKQKSVITVYTDDPNNQEYEIALTGYVKAKPKE